jgi:hypothetical protein
LTPPDANADRNAPTLNLYSTPDGRKTSAFPGGVEPNGALVGVAEFAYGVTDWFEQGL